MLFNFGCVGNLAKMTLTELLLRVCVVHFAERFIWERASVASFMLRVKFRTMVIIPAKPQGKGQSVCHMIFAMNTDYFPKQH
jgi:hypothetical protein